MLEFDQDGIIYVPSRSRDRLICGCCKSLIFDPVQNMLCNHSYCKQCIEDWIANCNAQHKYDANCPKCLTPLPKNKLNQAQQELMVDPFIIINGYSFERDTCANMILTDLTKRLGYECHRAQSRGYNESPFVKDLFQWKIDEEMRVCSKCQMKVRGSGGHTCYDSLKKDRNKWRQKYQKGLHYFVDRFKILIQEIIDTKANEEAVSLQNKNRGKYIKDLKIINSNLEKEIIRNGKNRKQNELKNQELKQKIKELEKKLQNKEYETKEVIDKNMELNKQIQSKADQIKEVMNQNKQLNEEMDKIRFVWEEYDNAFKEKLNNSKKIIKMDNILLRKQLNKINQKYSAIKQQKRETDEEFKEFKDEFDQQKYELTTIRSTIELILTKLPNNIIIISDFTLFLDYLVDNINIDLGHYIRFKSEENVIALNAEYRDVVKVMFTIHPNLRMIILEISEDMCQQIQSQLDLRDTTNILIDNHSEGLISLFESIFEIFIHFQTRVVGIL